VGLIPPDGVAFTGEGKLVRKATVYEHQKAEAALSRIGPRAARAELPAAIGAYLELDLPAAQPKKEQGGR
jgi:hypothetical protein